MFVVRCRPPLLQKGKKDIDQTAASPCPAPAGTWQRSSRAGKLRARSEPACFALRRGGAVTIST